MIDFVARAGSGCGRSSWARTQGEANAGSHWRTRGRRSSADLPCPNCAGSRHQSCSAKLGCYGGELAWIGRLREPRELQGIVLVAWDHVHVEVKDRLPGGATHVAEDVEAGRFERLAHPIDHPP